MSRAMIIIEMPKDCSSCEFEEYRKDTDWGDGEYCYINSGQCTTGSRPGHCPLINSEKDVFIYMAERLKGNKCSTSLDYCNGYDCGVNDAINTIIEYFEDLEVGENDI